MYDVCSQRVDRKSFMLGLKSVLENCLYGLVTFSKVFSEIMTEGFESVAQRRNLFNGIALFLINSYHAYKLDASIASSTAIRNMIAIKLVHTHLDNRLSLFSHQTSRTPLAVPLSPTGTATLSSWSGPSRATTAERPSPAT